MRGWIKRLDQQETHKARDAGSSVSVTIDVTATEGVLVVKARILPLGTNRLVMMETVKTNKERKAPQMNEYNKPGLATSYCTLRRCQAAHDSA